MKIRPCLPFCPVFFKKEKELTQFKESYKMPQREDQHGFSMRLFSLIFTRQWYL